MAQTHKAHMSLIIRKSQRYELKIRDCMPRKTNLFNRVNEQILLFYYCKIPKNRLFFHSQPNIGNHTLLGKYSGNREKV